MDQKMVKDLSVELEQNAGAQHGGGLSPYLSLPGAWALALGTAIGWGSLVVTSNTYLVQAGPLGSVLGLLMGAAAMVIIARNYHYLMGCFPDAGGLYTYTKETFGHDYGFLTSWFLVLTYAAMLWANATSLPLFARYFIGDFFRFGKMYTVFGYDVYFGEALLTMEAILAVSIMCMRFRRASAAVMTGLAILLAVCITVCFAGAMAGAGREMSAAGGTVHPFSPMFIPDQNAWAQVVRIACISPWAFIGFENISHASEEFTFPRVKAFRILTAAVLTAAVLYVFVLLLSVSARPAQYGSWLAYIRDHENLPGIEGLPAFYAVRHYLGSLGVRLLMLALLALIITSLIGNTLALSRLLYALARDGVLPDRFARLSCQETPANAIILIALLSLFVPFAGRTAIGWIVDVTTIGATMVYGFTSAAAVHMAKIRGDRLERWTGSLGLFLMLFVGAFLLFPNLFSAGTMAKETYFLFVIWSVLGFLFFHNILQRDSTRRFGRSIIVWIALLTFVLFIALIWMNQSMMESTDRAMERIRVHYQAVQGGLPGEASGSPDEDVLFIQEEFTRLDRTNSRTLLVVAGLFAFSMTVLFTNYTFMKKKERESEVALGHARDIAFSDPLTGVKSKHAFNVKENGINEMIREGTEEPFAVAVCDVNGLKHVNDTYGHKAGDEYIRSACRMICEIFQHSPVFRIGGDEFVVILAGSDYTVRAELMAELLRRSEENILLEKAVVAGGISDYEPGADTDMHAVFERADARMYENKQALKQRGARTRD